MSWLNNLTDLAGKAESLLNNIDQSAAVAISKAKDPAEENSNIKSQSHSLKDVPTGAEDIAAPKLESSLRSTHEPSKLSRAKMQTKKREAERSQKSKPTDDALFDFLNSDEKASKKSVTVKKVPSKGVTSLKPVHLDRQKMESHSLAPVAPVPATLEISRSSSFDSEHSKLGARPIGDSGSSSSEPHETISEAGEFNALENKYYHCIFLIYAVSVDHKFG